MNDKWMWIGQRLSDGVLFSRALNGLDIYFSCDDIIGNYPPSSCVYLCSPKEKNVKRTSNHIQAIVNHYCDKINNYIKYNYSVFPYFLSNEAQSKLLNSNTQFNKNVFKNQLSRCVQMYLMESAGINTPRWIVPKSLSWSELTSKLGNPIIVQFDNTSSGLGTFCIESELSYERFCQKFGEADIAAEYIDNGISCSAHLFITPNSIILSSPSVQIIEKHNLLNYAGIYRFSFKGNDFGYYNFNIGVHENIVEALLSVGKVYQKVGILGLLGVDFIIKDNVFYYNETNFRLQNSTALLSFLQPVGPKNIVQCLYSNPSEFSDVLDGFQYFVEASVPNISSGYFSIMGERLGDCCMEKYYKQSGVVLVFASNYTCQTQSLRIIGFDKCLDQSGNVDSRIYSFINKLVQFYG